MCSARRSCLSHAGWCLQSDAMPDSRLQGIAHHRPALAWLACVLPPHSGLRAGGKKEEKKEWRGLYSDDLTINCNERQRAPTPRAPRSPRLLNFVHGRNFRRQVTRGWSPARHFLYHRGVRNAVRDVLLAAHRLSTCAERRRRPVTPASASATATTAAAPMETGAGHVLPLLNDEDWYLIGSFLLRADWPPC